ncbi:DNA polymerase I [Candidatus Parcubacteria bacterium]|nr:DNA polymerase I [Candidatus Parcubacteria bacterium]
MPKKLKKLMIIDGNALIHRSFHALPPTMTTKDGTVVNAVYGFMSFLIKAMRDLKPEYVVLTLDKKGPTFRHKKFKEYKAKRVKAPDELYAQIPMVKKLAEDFNIPVFEKDGFEADDLIGTIAAEISSRRNRALPCYCECVIVTGDKDTLQLVNEHTKVYSMSRGLSDAILYNSELVKEKMGVRVDQVVDYKALSGDASDNIPGVPGIGAKTAVALLKEFDNLDNLYDYAARQPKANPPRADNTQLSTEKIKPRILDLLVKHKKSAYLSQELATIKCDVKINFDLEATRFFDLDKDKIVKALSELEFKSLLPRVQNLFNEVGADTKEKKQQATEDKFERNRKDFKYILVDTESKFKKFLTEIKKQKHFTFDTETSGFDPITCDLLGISFSWKKGAAYFVKLRIKNNELSTRRNRALPCSINNKSQGSLFGDVKKPDIAKGNEKWLEKLKSVFADEKVKKTAHNAKFDVRVLKNKGVAVRGVDFDTMLASYLLNPGTRGHGLDALTFTELGFEKISKNDLLGMGKDKKIFGELEMEKLSLYSCEDADFTERLRYILKPKLKKENLETLFKTIEMPLIDALSHMEDTGVRIDAEFLSRMSKKMTKKIKALEKEIHDMAGESFNIRSTKQLKYILFEKMELPTEAIKKTKTGFSTGADELEKLKEFSPIISLIQEHRELNKLVSTYIDALPELVNEKTGRVHTSYNQTVTATGRLSSTKPNLQNIPVKTDLGKEIRKAFVADKGYKLLALDYSQIELRLAAHMSGDKKIIKAFKNGADIHSSTAAEINNVSLEKVDTKMRREAKAINFGILYGQGPRGLSRAADIPYAQAKDFIDNYFKVYSGIKKYIDEKIAFARENGYTETLYKRKRYLPEINSSILMVKKGAERMAVNTPIQGTAADIIKIAMIEVMNKVCNDKAKMLMQVHDELIFEIKDSETEKETKKIKDIMEGVIKLDVPIIVDVKVGENWGEMEVV